MSDLLFPRYGSPGIQSQEQAAVRRKKNKYTMFGILPSQYHDQLSNSTPSRTVIPSSISALLESSVEKSDTRTPVGPKVISRDTLKSTAEDEDYRIRPSASESKSAALLRLTDLLFSESYLQRLVNDPQVFPRFNAFFKRYKPELSPILSKYVEYQKLRKALDYANAIASIISGVPESHTASPPSVELSFSFRTSLQPTIETLLCIALPAWVTYSLVQVTTSSLAADITNETTPLTRDIVRGLGEAFCITDPNQKDNPIVYASEEFYKFTGYGRDAVIGRNCRFLQGEKTKPASVERLRSAARKGEEISETLLNYRRDGTPFVNVLMMAPLHDAKGNLRYYLGAQVDVSRLVENGRGLDGFKELFTKEQDRGRQPWMGEKITPKQNMLAKQRDLSLSFDLEENPVSQAHSVLDSSTKEEDGSSGREGMPSSSNRSQNLDMESEHNSAESKIPQKLPGIYNTYLLIRPYPSLRTIFVSQEARKLGQFQQRPFLAHTAAPQSTLTELKDAFKSGTPVTAKIALTDQTGKTREGTVTGSWDGDDSPAHQGKTCWISATPLLDSEDMIGVWMVVIVDEKGVEAKTEQMPEEVVQKADHDELPEPSTSDDKSNKSDRASNPPKDEEPANHKEGSQRDEITDIESETRSVKATLEEPEDILAASEQLESDAIPEHDSQTKQGMVEDEPAENKNPVPEEKVEAVAYENPVSSSNKENSGAIFEHDSKTDHSMNEDEPAGEKTQGFEGNLETVKDEKPIPPTANKDEETNSKSSVFSSQALESDPIPNSNHDAQSEDSMPESETHNTDHSEIIDDISQHFSSSTHQAPSILQFSSPKIPSAEPCLNSVPESAPESIPDSANVTPLPTQDIPKELSFTPTKSPTDSPLPAEPQFSPPPSPALSSTSTDSLDLDPDLLRERKLNGIITKPTPPKHREYIPSKQIQPPRSLTVRRKKSFGSENVSIRPQDYDGFEEDVPVAVEAGESESMDILDQNILSVTEIATDFSQDDTAATIPDIPLVPREKTTKSTLGGNFFKLGNGALNAIPTSKFNTSAPTQIFTLDPHEGIWGAHEFSRTKIDHDLEPEGLQLEREDVGMKGFDTLPLPSGGKTSMMMRSASWIKGSLEDIREESLVEGEGEGEGEGEEGGKCGKERLILDRKPEEHDTKRGAGVDLGMDGDDDEEEQEEQDEWADAQPYIEEDWKF